MHVCVSCVCVPGAGRGQKNASNPLELELQEALSCNVGAGD